MDEEDFDYEDLREMVMNEYNRVYTIDECIKAKEEENQSINESFKVLWETYKYVIDERKDSIKRFNSTKYKLFISNLVLLLIRYDVRDEIIELQKFINKSTLTLKEEKELLTTISNSIKKLESLNAYYCNHDLNLLLSYIFDKNLLIYKEVCSKASNTAARIRGFATQSKDFTTDIKETEDNINECMLKLGLK